MLAQMSLPAKISDSLTELNGKTRDAWVAQSVKCLPLAQIMILGSWDQALNPASCSVENLLLPLLLLLPLFVLARSLSLANK